MRNNISPIWLREVVIRAKIYPGRRSLGAWIGKQSAHWAIAGYLNEQGLIVENLPDIEQLFGSLNETGSWWPPQMVPVTLCPLFAFLAAGAFFSQNPRHGQIADSWKIGSK
jgi:hypothetical protein